MVHQRHENVSKSRRSPPVKGAGAFRDANAEREGRPAPRHRPAILVSAPTVQKFQSS